MLTTCSEPGCATLVMGGRCLEHERGPTRIFVRGRPFATAPATDRAAGTPDPAKSNPDEGSELSPRIRQLILSFGGAVTEETWDPGAYAARLSLQRTHPSGYLWLVRPA
jgi:hypothetical protein